MEDWLLDRLINVMDAVLWLLDLLNIWWVAASVELAAAIVFAFLTMGEPGRNWTFIKERPARFFLGAFFVLSYFKLTHWPVNPQVRFGCDSPPPLSQQDGHQFSPPTGCKFNVVGQYDSYTFANFLLDGLQNFVVGLPFAILGFAIGWVARTIATEGENDRGR